jgi:4a-hydroxytetrahydrobiopterin dehydratase
MPRRVGMKGGGKQPTCGLADLPEQLLIFVQEIGELAEAEGHHPNISFGWGNATVSLQTKKIKGLHENDFIMATKIDRIFARTATA